MKTIAIIQARTDSTRLPGKVLKKLGNMLVIERVVARLNECKSLDDLVVATSTENTDDELVSWCDNNQVKVFRGSLHDVLDRYYRAAIHYKAENIVRITGDCPLIDPQIVDKVIEEFQSGSFDAAGLHGEFPDGLDCTFFSRNAITSAHLNAKKSYQREHIGQYIEENMSYFSCGEISIFDDDYGLRLTLDEPADYLFMQKIVQKLKVSDFSILDIIKLHRQNPALAKINNNIKRNEGLIKSMEIYNADK